jgi:hypothetical protein
MFDPVTIVGKYLLGKLAKETIYRMSHGMGPKEYFKLRLQLIVSLYDKEQKVTQELLDLFAHSSSADDLERIANHAGSVSLIDDILAKNNPANEFFNSKTYDFLMNYEYYSEELGQSLSKKELDTFFNLAKKIIDSL